MLIAFGQTASHSRKLEQLPKSSDSICSTMLTARVSRSACPWGRRLRCPTFAAVKSCAAPLGHWATQAPQPDDAVEGGPVDHQVLHDRKSGRAPRLDDNRVAVCELAHVELTRRRARLRSVRLAVHHHAARAANPFAAVMVESDRTLALFFEALVQHVQHFQKGIVWPDVVDLVGLKRARSVLPLLSPNLEGQLHYL